MYRVVSYNNVVTQLADDDTVDTANFVAASDDRKDERGGEDGCHDNEDNGLR